MQDPLIKQTGTLRGLSDMLTNGEKLLRHGYRRWPKGVPLLLIHGTADKVRALYITGAKTHSLQVTDHRSSETFVNSLPTDYKKKVSLFEVSILPNCLTYH